MSFLSGLGALGGGLTQGLEAGSDFAYKRKARQREDTSYQDQQGGKAALMRTLLGGGQAPMGPQMQPGQPSQPMQLPSAGGGQGAGYAMPRMELIDLIQKEATKRGIDPAVALRVAQSEGLGSYTGDQGSSFGPYQLHYGGVAPGGNRVPGLGDEFTKSTGLNARDPGTVPQQVAFALDKAKEGGWGPWHGWKGDPRAGLPGGGQQPQPQGGMPQQGGGGDWRSFAQRIIQTNPGITPGQFFEALQGAAPFMSMESKQELAVMRAQMQGEIAGMRTGAMRDIAEQRSEDTRRGQDIGLKKTETTVSASMERFRTAQQGIQNRFNQRFAQGERKIADAKTKSERAAELTKLRQAELDRRAAAANAIKAAAAGMDIEELKKLEAEERAARDEADRKIDQLTVQQREGKQTPAAASGGKPLDDAVKQQMQEAISKGKTREEVIAKAREMGYDVSGF